MVTSTRLATVLLATVLACVAVGVGASSGAGRRASTHWKLIWHDEFLGGAGKPPATAKWRYDIGSDFGNNELEYYTQRTANVRLNGSGQLEIVARRQAYAGRQYTSGRIKTQGVFAQKYGRFEARMRIPPGQGLWPAFWMLGNNITKAGWPNCGEIDVMEAIGKEPNTVYGSIHGPGYIGGLVSKSYVNPKPLANGYHVYAIEWSPARIAFFLDGVRYAVDKPSDLPTGTNWAFNRPFFMILNLAVGGDWPGSPDSSTHFPAKLLVDYVRVYSAV